MSQSSTTHLVLHSFPTRRSSDLSAGGTRGERMGGVTLDQRGGDQLVADVVGPFDQFGRSGHRGLPDLIDGDLHGRDRKSTRLNSSHVAISYAVFCLKKKKHYRLR